MLKSTPQYKLQKPSRRIDVKAFVSILSFSIDRACEDTPSV
ncbi:MAG: hypothetical protein U5L45_03175 [Saprospiraceae bacterium]|nr:hypothetical protein [Saprospiraceae bacterium]